jgi:hypothetical protein
LDGLLKIDERTGRTPLAWLRRPAATHSPAAMGNTLRKLVFCRDFGVDRWEISALTPNRLKGLARIARCTTNQGLQRMAPTRRHPILVAFLSQSWVEATDEALDQGFQGGAPNILIWFALVCGNTRARISKPLRIKAELFSP